MTTAKQECLDLIEQLPDGASTEAIVAELEFKLLIEQRLDEVERGVVISHDEAKKRLAKWLDSSGRDVKPASCAASTSSIAENRQPR